MTSTLYQHYQSLLRHDRVDYGDFIVRHPDLSPAEKLALALLDQRERVGKAEPVPVEEYLRHLPEFADDCNVLLDFIAGEYSAGCRGLLSAS